MRPHISIICERASFTSNMATAYPCWTELGLLGLMVQSIVMINDANQRTQIRSIVLFSVNGDDVFKVGPM